MPVAVDSDTPLKHCHGQWINQTVQVRPARCAIARWDVRSSDEEPNDSS